MENGESIETKSQENDETTQSVTPPDDTQLDMDELKKLLTLCTRSRVSSMLNDDIKQLETLRSQASNSSSSKPDRSEESHVLTAKTTLIPQKYYKDITNYAWDQSDKFMKIYVSLTGLESLAKDDFRVEFTEKSFRLKVENLASKNYQCHVAFLYGKIVPAESYHKVKSDSILLMLRKVEEKTWAFVTEQEGKEEKRKKANKPAVDKEKDPSEGLMGLLKQMYDDGDDEMKKTIAKSWTESRNKPGGGDMGF